MSEEEEFEKLSELEQCIACIGMMMQQHWPDVAYHVVAGDGDRAASYHNLENNTQAVLLMSGAMEQYGANCIRTDDPREALNAMAQQVREVVGEEGDPRE